VGKTIVCASHGPGFPPEGFLDGKCGPGSFGDIGQPSGPR
jgi:hypothetical protein